MGICADCIYHVQNGNGIFENNKRISGHLCQNLNQTQTDFITGKTSFGDCYLLNGFGECAFFKHKNEVRYNAWQNCGRIIYTKDNAHSIGDEVFTKDEEGNITLKDKAVEKIAVYYGWWNSDKNIVIFTSKNPSALEQGDEAISGDKRISYTIDKVDSEFTPMTITINDTVFTRNEVYDSKDYGIVVDGVEYEREFFKDFTRIEESTEKETADTSTEDTETSETTNNEPSDKNTDITTDGEKENIKGEQP